MCYINGQQVTPGCSYCSNGLLSANLTLDSIQLGKPISDSYYFKGEMDEVRVSSSYLDPGSIRQHAWQGIDATPPGQPVMVQEPPFTSYVSGGCLNANSVACLPATDNESGVIRYQFRCLSGETIVSESPWIRYMTYSFSGLTSGQTYSYQARAQDRMGNIGAWSGIVSSTQDEEVPDVVWCSDCVIPGTINGNRLEFALPISASDSLSGITLYNVDDQLYHLPSPAPSVSALPASLPFQWGRSYDNLSFRVGVQDAVENYDWSYCHNIDIDYMGPSGNIEINSGAYFTSDPAVTLNLTYHDYEGGSHIVSQMQFSNDNVTWSDWMAASPTADWQLSPGYGVKSVYARWKGAFGHISGTYVDTIVYGGAPSGSISIDSDAAWTTSRNVTLTLNATNAVQMAIWNDNPSYLPNPGTGSPMPRLH